MQLYRFSPIESENALKEVVEHVHKEAHKLCKQSFGEYLPIAGNVAIFCHFDDEYEYLTKLREEITDPSDNWNQKYFALKEPIHFTERDGTPAATYAYLYIRKPDPYRHHVGDIDFYLPEPEYEKQKSELEAGKVVPGARLFPSPHLDMIELYDFNSDVLAYVSTHTITDVVRSTSSGA